MLLLSLQGVRVSETPEGISSLDPSRGESINVEPGCSWPDPCDSNPCPTNSYCSNDWDSYSCSCDPGMRRMRESRAGATDHVRGIATWLRAEVDESSRGWALDLSDPSRPRLLW